MLQNQLSQLLLLSQNILKWDHPKKRNNSSEKMLLPKEVYVNFIIQSKMVSLPTGTIWRKFGIIVISTNSESNQKITPLCLQKLHVIHLKTEKECVKFSSKTFKFHNSTFLSKLFFHFTLPVELLVALLMLEMVLPILFQYSKDILYHIVSKEMILPVDN
jgi:hypothetical protein